EDLVLAPIVERGVTSRTVQLPPGTWRRWLDYDAPLGELQSGEVTASASIDDPVLFVRAGAVVPLLGEDYDSLVPERADAPVDPSVRLAPKEITHLRLLLVGGADGAGSAGGDYGIPAVSYTWSGAGVSGALV